MSKSSPFADTIGEWTQAELQNFIQNVGQLAPSQLPPSYSSDQIQANGITVAQQLNLTQGAQLLQDGYQYPSIAVPAASFTGDIVPIYADTSGLGAARASGSTLVAASFDLPDATDQTGLVNGRGYWTRMYVPARTPINNVYLFNSLAPSAGGYTQAEVGFYKMDSMDQVSGHPNLTRLLHWTGVGSDWNSTSTAGVKTYNSATPVMLDPGIYYGALVLAWTSITGAVAPAGLHSPLSSQNASFLGGAPASLYKDLAGATLAASYISTDFSGSANNRHWVAIY